MTDKTDDYSAALPYEPYTALSVEPETTIIFPDGSGYVVKAPA